MSDNTITIGDLILRPDLRLMDGPRRTVRLGRLRARLLVRLNESAGQLVPFELLAQAMWGDGARPASERGRFGAWARVLNAELRYVGSQTTIHQVRGEGYALLPAGVPVVRQAVALTVPKVRAAADRLVTCGDLTLDALQHAVVGPAGAASITPHECGVLLPLMRRHGTPMTYEQLICTLWADGGPDTADNCVKVYVHGLRKTLASVGSRSKVQNVWGRGYVFVPSEASTVVRLAQEIAALSAQQRAVFDQLMAGAATPRPHRPAFRRRHE